MDFSHTSDTQPPGISIGAFRNQRSWAQDDAQSLGDNQDFTLRSPGYPSFVYNYPSFSAGALGVQNARIWGGIHYRFATQVGAAGGATIADYIFANFMQPRGNRGSGN